MLQSSSSWQPEELLIPLRKWFNHSIISSLTFGRDYNGDVCGSETTHPGAKAYGCDEGICTQVYYPKVNEDVAFSVALVIFSAVYLRIECIILPFRYLSSQLS